ncbi:MAG: BON domain-containing protein [Planctomycetaceae bacterium]|nr:BON domain-containing protein [Planctomycetaceae bacterium]
MLPCETPAETAKKLLAKTSYKELGAVTLVFHEGVLTMRGTVPSFHLKQVAQTVVQGIREVNQIENHIEVLPETR